MSNVAALKDIQPAEVRQAVLRAYGDSLRVIWIVATPIAAFGLACSFVIKVYSLTNKESTKLDIEKKGAKGEQQDSSALSDSQATLANEGDQTDTERRANGDSTATSTVPQPGIEVIEEEPFPEEAARLANGKRTPAAGHAA